jgi:quercetin dioxygenase-like cupin family protein
MNFDEIAEQTIPHMKGGEGAVKARISDDGKVKIMRGVLEPGSSIGLHKHEDSAEIVYVIEGVMTVLMNGKKELYHPGEVHYCPKGSSHEIRNEGKKTLVCLCVVPKQ